MLPGWNHYYAALLLLVSGSVFVDASINVTSPVDATALATMIAGPGIVVTSAQLFCARPEQAGLFENFDPNEPATTDDLYPCKPSRQDLSVVTIL